MMNARWTRQTSGREGTTAAGKPLTQRYYPE